MQQSRNIQKRRACIEILGAVQGVGFRPFIYRLAREMGLSGWVINAAEGVRIEAEGTADVLEMFVTRIAAEKPTVSSIYSLEHSLLDPVGYEAFEIRHSEANGTRRVFILPDIATCPECLGDTFDPDNRRFLYPFTNCTHCGPRFSIIRALPYDRPNTTMADFALCDHCREEYENPKNRRFHAQPNACPVCGPQLALWSPRGETLAAKHDALLETAQAIRKGRIIAIKGLGGFHLVCDARNREAIETLRERKHRRGKPFAIMYPALSAIQQDCMVSDVEASALQSSAAPIVLLRRETTPVNLETPDACPLAPGNPHLGVMLPYTPLHHILMRELGFPIVATSGNLSEEPICIDEQEALKRLGTIADLFLVHNRPIQRHVDDSIVRVMADRPIVLRRARGYAPLPVHADDHGDTILAVGPHLKNTVALSREGHVFISQHIGDLESKPSNDAFQAVINDFERLYEAPPIIVAHDLHPDYLSTHYALKRGLPTEGVQHHHAHIAACMAENELEGETLGVAWDGTGYGPDKTIWGGEFLVSTRAAYRRAAHLRTFALPSGDAAIRSPARIAAGLLFAYKGAKALSDTELFPHDALTDDERRLLAEMLSAGIQCPRTSSVGRLFDAVSALLGICYKATFEGRAAMELEYAASEEEEGTYPFLCNPDNDEDSPMWILDWAPMIDAILEEARSGIDAGLISARFHTTLSHAVVAVAERVEQERVVLSGGCFQNRLLTERTVEALRDAGFQPYWHQRVPPNDGGVAFGQAVVAAARMGSEKKR